MSVSQSRSNSWFISVLTEPTSPGSLVFDVTTVDAASANIDVTVTVTSVVTGTSVEDLAQQIYDAFTDQLLTDYAYSGSAVFSDTEPNGTFRAHLTDHIASLWSQCVFKLKLISNTTGALISIDSNPNFVTVAFALNFAAIKGFSFALSDGTPFTDAQIVSALASYNAEAIAKLGHFIIEQTYLNQFRGKDHKSVFLKPKPVIYRDNIRVKQKAFNTIFNFPGYSATSFNCVNSTGELNYIPDSTLVNTRPPFRMDNEVQLTIVSGFTFIPDELKQAVINLYSYDSVGLAGLKSLAGDSFKLEMANTKDILSRIWASLKPFKG